MDWRNEKNRIIQTFWSSHGSALLSSYGWPHAEYNLMSWALSCLSLREHYDDVELYTDTEGYRILIEQMRLPYSHVHVVLDDFACLPFHWALAKIKTYSMQDVPFVHVDGDIYLPNPLKEEIFDAELVAQNREIGTIYYWRMMERILAQKNIILPPIAQKAINEHSIASYNMGFFGGKDLDFIHDYCDVAFQFVEQNHLNDVRYNHVSLNCNVFFEQILFALIADDAHRKVESVLGWDMEDRGYTGREFCDFLRYGQKSFLHLLGGHKQNRYYCEMLEKTLLRLYPEYHKRVVELFPERHIRFDKSFHEPMHITDDMPSEDYAVYLSGLQKDWADMTVNQLYEWEEKCSRYPDFITASTAKRLGTVLEANPHVVFYEIPNESDEEVIGRFRKRLKCEPYFPVKWITFRPTLRGSGIKEFAVLDDEYQVLRRLKEGPTSVGELQRDLYSENEETSISIRPHLYEGLKTLLHHGLLAIVER